MKISKDYQRRAVNVSCDDLVIGEAFNYAFADVAPDNRKQGIVFDLARVTLSAPSVGGVVWKVSGGVPLSSPLLPLTSNVDFAYGFVAANAGIGQVTPQGVQVVSADIRPDTPLFIAGGGQLLASVEKTANMTAGVVLAIEVWYRTAELTTEELLAVSGSGFGGSSG